MSETAKAAETRRDLEPRTYQDAALTAMQHHIETLQKTIEVQEARIQQLTLLNGQAALTIQNYQKMMGASMSMAAPPMQTAGQAGEVAKALTEKG